MESSAFVFKVFVGCNESSGTQDVSLHTRRQAQRSVV